ncbi:MAG: hypothetical protein ABII71_00895 [Candidatus Micrarchaeota archaeon]
MAQAFEVGSGSRGSGKVCAEGTKLTLHRSNLSSQRNLRDRRFTHPAAGELLKRVLENHPRADELKKWRAMSTEERQDLVETMKTQAANLVTGNMLKALGKPNVDTAKEALATGMKASGATVSEMSATIALIEGCGDDAFMLMDSAVRTEYSGGIRTKAPGFAPKNVLIVTPEAVTALGDEVECSENPAAALTRLVKEVGDYRQAMSA